MYSVNSEWTIKGQMAEIIEITGFPMGSNHKIYKIEGSKVKAISISNKQLAYPLAKEIVSKKFNKLIRYITAILIEEDIFK